MHPSSTRVAAIDQSQLVFLFRPKVGQRFGILPSVNEQAVFAIFLGAPPSSCCTSGLQMVEGSCLHCTLIMGGCKAEFVAVRDNVDPAVAGCLRHAAVIAHAFE